MQISAEQPVNFILILHCFFGTNKPWMSYGFLFKDLTWEESECRIKYSKIENWEAFCQLFYTVCHHHVLLSVIITLSLISKSDFRSRKCHHVCHQLAHVDAWPGWKVIRFLFYVSWSTLPLRQGMIMSDKRPNVFFQSYFFLRHISLKKINIGVGVSFCIWSLKAHLHST